MAEPVKITLQLKGGLMEATGMAGHCRSCGADVVFVRMPTGKTPPFNPDGITHFATCPQAEKWKGKAKVANPPIQPDPRLKQMVERP